MLCLPARGKSSRSEIKTNVLMLTVLIYLYIFQVEKGGSVFILTSIHRLLIIFSNIWRIFSNKSPQTTTESFVFLYFFPCIKVAIQQYCRIYRNNTNNSIEHLTDESLLETMFFAFCTQRRSLHTSTFFCYCNKSMQTIGHMSTI